MPSFEIRKTVVSDAAGVASVKYHSWHDTYRGIISDAYLDSMNVEQLTLTWQKILSAENKRNTTNIMLNEKEQVIGFVSHAVHRNEEYGTDGEIMALYLLKEHQGLGLGAKLFRHGVMQLNETGVKSFHLNVLSKNPAVAFYRKFRPNKEMEGKINIGGVDYDELTMIWNGLSKIIGI